MKSCINHKDRRVFSKGLCAACYKQQYSKPLKRTPLKKKPFFIKPIADRRKKQLQAYKPLRNKYLMEHPICEMKLLNCQIKSNEIHHTQGRENELLLAVDTFKAVCRNCHNKIHDNNLQ